MTLSAYRKQFDIYLQTRLTNKLAHVKPMFPDDETFDLLTYLEPYVDHGKRFRPYMVYVWYTLYGWDAQTSDIYLSCGLVSELIHIYALIHDDICDQGTTRHQIPTYHMELWRRYDDAHIGLSQAMLVWDLVYTRAMEILITTDIPQPVRRLYMTMLENVVCWQMLDVHFSVEQTTRTLEAISTKDHLKSGQYTFQAPMLIWAYLWMHVQSTLLSDQESAKIAEIGREIGVAFQWRDDLLDRLPNSEWKTKMSDIQEWNQTVVMLKLLDLLDVKDAAYVSALRWSTLADKDRQRLTDLVTKIDISWSMWWAIHERLEEVRRMYAWCEGAHHDSTQLFLDIVNMLEITW